MKQLLAKLLGFTGFPLLALAIPIILLPVIARLTDEAGWSSVLAGQAIGTFAGTVVLWGWNIEGPVRIARSASPTERAAVYMDSLRTRIVLLIVVVPVVTVLVAVVSAPPSFVDALSMAWASMLAGISPAWFCIGLGKPRLLAAYDTLPRVAATLLATPLLLLTRQIWVYPAVLGLAITLALVMFHRRIGARGSWLPQTISSTSNEIRRQLSTAGINVAANAYASSPVPLAAGTRVPDVAAAGFSSADQIFRYGTFAIAAVGNTFQSWTIEPDVANRRQRHMLAITVHCALGILGAATLTFAGPWATSLLFGAEKSATPLVCFAYGIAYVFLSSATPLIRNLLIPAGRQRLVLTATIVTAVVGLAIMSIAGLAGSADGIAWGMAAGEAVMFLCLVPSALREFGRLRDSNTALGSPHNAPMA